MTLSSDNEPQFELVSGDAGSPDAPADDQPAERAPEDDEDDTDRREA